MKMTQQQKARAYDLYKLAANMMATLCNEPLNLDANTLAALYDARGALEKFDHLRRAQPLQEAE